MKSVAELLCATVSTLKAPDRMAIWVKSHLDFIEEAVGMPSLIKACVDTRTNQPVDQK